VNGAQFETRLIQYRFKSHEVFIQVTHLAPKRFHPLKSVPRTQLEVGLDLFVGLVKLLLAVIVLARQRTSAVGEPHLVAACTLSRDCRCQRSTDACAQKFSSADHISSSFRKTESPKRVNCPSA
jgi:hypothetical protein